MHIICELYIDDVIISGSTEEEFLANLERVLQRFRERNVVLHPDKAKIGLTQLEYVGHVINEHGLQMSEEKKGKVLDFPLARTGKNLKQFLGLVNYFRDHVRDFTGLAYPLQQMLLIDYEDFRARRLKWTLETMQSFEDVKAAISNCSMLYFMTEGYPIYVATDASDYGIGAYLYQIDN